MEIDKETITNVGGITAILGAIALFWHRFTARFVRKDMCEKQTEFFTKEMERQDAVAIRQGKLITQARDASIKACISSDATKDLLEGMKKNIKKRKGD